MTNSRSLPILLGLLWLVGNAMRLPILAVPPVIPALRGEFNLTGTQIGVLTGLPVVLFAAAALLGSRLVSRLGAVTAVVIGLALTAIGSALRGLAPDVVSLFAATIVMGGGVAVIQPAMPALVGKWLPQRIALGTGTYTNGLLVGEVLPVALFPLLLPLLAGGWRGTFVFWGAAIALIAVVFVVLAPRETGVRSVAAARWWPDWPARDVLRLSLVFASASALYYASNAFLPGHLIQENRAELVNPALTALNFGQLPASLLLIGFGHRIERKIWPFVAAGIVSLICVGLLVTTAEPAIVVASTGIFGFAIGAAFALCLTLPPLLSAPQEVARVSAAMFTISYASAMAVAVVSGVAWDVTGVESFTFLPIALAALPLLVLAPTIPFDRRPPAVLERPGASA